MHKRIEQALTYLATQRAPHVLYQVPKPPAPERPQLLAEALAREGLLVLWADVPASLGTRQQEVINQWVTLYGNLYRTLTDALFTQLGEVRASMIDNAPTLALLDGLCAPVIRAVAGYVVPYVAHRHGTSPNLMEMRGMMDYILEDLQGLTLPLARQKAVIEESTHLISALVGLPLVPKSLTAFKRPVIFDAPKPTEIIPRAMFDALKNPPPPLSTPVPPPQEPPAPEPPKHDTPTLKASMPLLPSRRKRDDRKPPVPKPPTNPKKKDS
jgi:hypothetical protein